MGYEHRFGPFFVSTIVAGLETDKNGVTKPYISGTDLIGACGYPEDFITAGASSDQLMGICEALWRPKMKQDGLTNGTSLAEASPNLKSKHDIQNNYNNNYGC